MLVRKLEFFDPTYVRCNKLYLIVNKKPRKTRNHFETTLMRCDSAQYTTVQLDMSLYINTNTDFYNVLVLLTCVAHLSLRLGCVCGVYQTYTTIVANMYYTPAHFFIVGSDWFLFFHGK